MRRALVVGARRRRRREARRIGGGVVAADGRLRRGRGGGARLGAVAAADDRRAGVDVLDDEDDVLEREARRGVGADDGQLQVVHQVEQLLVGLDLREGDVDDRAAGVVRERLDEARLARAGRAVQQQPELVREAAHRVLALPLLEVVQQPHQVVLLREEERVEGLRVGELVALVHKRRALVGLAVGALLALAVRLAVDHRVQPALVLALLLELRFVPLERRLDEVVDLLGAVGLQRA